MCSCSRMTAVRSCASSTCDDRDGEGVSGGLGTGIIFVSLLVFVVVLSYMSAHCVILALVSSRHPAMSGVLKKKNMTIYWLVCWLCCSIR